MDSIDTSFEKEGEHLLFSSLKIWFWDKLKISIFWCISTFCVLKKWVHSRIGQCVRPSGRLHDNSSKAHPIVMKFCTQNCLINISVEFEDENDSSRNGWVIAKNDIISYAFLCEHWPIPLFVKTIVSHNKKKPTIIYHSIENFTSYKMVYKTLRKNVTLFLDSLMKINLSSIIFTFWSTHNTRI